MKVPSRYLPGLNSTWSETVSILNISYTSYLQKFTTLYSVIHIWCLSPLEDTKCAIKLGCAIRKCKNINLETMTIRFNLTCKNYFFVWELICKIWPLTSCFKSMYSNSTSWEITKKTLLIILFSRNGKPTKQDLSLGVSSHSSFRIGNIDSSGHLQNFKSRSPQKNYDQYLNWIARCHFVTCVSYAIFYVCIAYNEKI